MDGRAKSMARGALAAALDLLLLYLTALLPTARLALLCAASLGVVFVALGSGAAWALGSYAVTAFLALLLLPGKGVAVVYLLLTGYYPVAKLWLERRGSVVVRWGGKLLLFNIVLLVLWAVSRFLFSLDLLSRSLPWYVLWLGANGVFILYDLALTQIILIYLRRIAGRIK